MTLDLESSLSGDRLAVSRLRVRSEKTSIEGTGEFSSLAARRGVFTTTADPLDLDEVLTIASAFSRPASGDASPVAQGPPLALDVRVEVKAPRGRLLGIDFTDLATTIALARGGVTLEPFGVGVFGGTVDGRLTVDTSSESSRVAVSAAVTSIDVARLAAFAGSSGVITGRLGGRIDLQASGGTPDAVFRTAGGRATLASRTAPCLGSTLVGPVIRAFGTAGGATAAATPASRSNAFSSIRGTFTLANGVLRTSDLAMASRDLDVKGQGTVRVEGAWVDMKADLILSEALTSEAGRDLVRYAREGNRVVLPATIRGGLASPSVSIDVQAAAARALRNTVEDEVKKGLGRLFKR